MGTLKMLVRAIIVLSSINITNVLADTVNKDAIWNAVHNNEFRTAE